MWTWVHPRLDAVGVAMMGAAELNECQVGPGGPTVSPTY